MDRFPETEFIMKQSIPFPWNAVTSIGYKFAEPMAEWPCWSVRVIAKRKGVCVEDMPLYALHFVQVPLFPLNGYIIIHLSTFCGRLTAIWKPQSLSIPGIKSSPLQKGHYGTLSMSRPTPTWFKYTTSYKPIERQSPESRKISGQKIPGGYLP